MRREACLAALVVMLLLTTTWSGAAVKVYQSITTQGALPALGDLPSDRVMSGFIAANGQPAAVQTRAAVLLDKRDLVLLVDCLEPQMDKLAAAAQGVNDAAVFHDDCVEVFLSSSGDHTPYYHFATNPNGARFAEKGRGGPTWQGAWTVNATRAADRWSVAMRIPLSALGGSPARGEVWWFNICRQRQVGGAQLSAWSPNGSNFHDSSCFAALTFDTAYAGYLSRYFLSPFDHRAAALRERSRIRSSAARHLEEALRPVGASLQPLRAAAKGAAPPPEQFALLLQTGQAALKQLDQAEKDLDEAITETEVARRMSAMVPRGTELLVWGTTAVTDRRILPTPEPPQNLSRNLSLRACRGEYEPVSFVVYPLRKPVTLDVKVSDLRGPQAIPSSVVDVRAVKCWYQAGGVERFPMNRGMHLMTPELLLRDDDLVRVDTASKRNLVKLQFPDGRTKWLDVSTTSPSAEEKDSSAEAMPIRDASRLQPVAVRARTAKQFWVTVHVPSDAKPGTYRGCIELSAGGRVLESLPLTVEVLPFALAQNPLESSIYFHWGLTLDTKGPGTLGIRVRTPAQFKAELRDLLEHGIDNPTIGVSPAGGQLADELRLRQEVGMRNDRLYYLVASAGSLPAEEIKRIIDIAKGFGFTEYYFYAVDEAQGDKLTAQRPSFEKVHAAGGKVFVAGSQGQNFPRVGDLQDLLVCYGDPSREEAAKWHSKGHKIFCYANPQGGIEAPEMNRRNYGLLLAANDYDGGMTYIYYSGIPSWNDYVIPPYRQHNFVYPTVDGVIDTVQWEGYREGIDDLRYLATLRNAIADAKAAGGRRAATACQAQAYLDNLDVTGDLNVVRVTMTDWILRLQ